MVYKNLIIAFVFLAFGLFLYFLGRALSKKNHSEDGKKTFADYHGEISLAGAFFVILSFGSFVFWLWLNFIFANR